MDNQLPPFIGKYAIEGELGKGGMSVVYKAKDSMGEIYALKLMTIQSNSVNEFSKRFQREIQLLETVEHPNIIKLYDMGEWRGQPYLVMEYIPGITLEEYLKKKQRLPLKEAVEIIWKIALALENIHNLKIIHRDIKPSNIILWEKTPYLMDFGVACYLDGRDRITKTGTSVGTLNYSPPEQAQGEWEDVGPWSDIYSLGLTLYHLVTGVAPFIGKTDFEILFKISQKSLRPASKYMPYISKKFEEVINKASHKNIQERYQNMTEFSKELENLLKEEHSLYDLGDPSRKNTNITLLFILPTLVILSLASILFIKKSRKKIPIEKKYELFLRKN